MTREEQLQRESEVYAWTANQFDIKLAFKKGAEWEHKRLVDKTREWLEYYILDGLGHYIVGDIIVEFRKAMEE